MSTINNSVPLPSPLGEMDGASVPLPLPLGGDGGGLGFFAEIILPLPLSDTFTYAIPLTMQAEAQVGVRVLVQFGQRKYYSGIIYRLLNEPPKTGFEIKTIEGILDDFPIITPKQMELWAWMSNYYCCTLGEVMKATLPSGLKLESETKFALHPHFDGFDALNNEQFQLAELLQKEGLSNVHAINKGLGKKSSLPLLKEMLEQNIVCTEETLKFEPTKKTITHIQLAPALHDESALQAALDSLQRAKKQYELLCCFLAEINENPLLEKKRLLEISGASDAVLRELCKKEMLETVEVETDRLDLDEYNDLRIHELNEAQQRAFLEINRLKAERKPILLHGVTSSGKTEIYIKLIEQCIAEGKQALFLVPEIGLTTQLIMRLKKAFGNDAGIYHSRFNDAERVEIWNKTLSGQYRVVIGARSAALLPFQQLGLIVVDEEHEQSFKQFDPNPRYQARDVAVVMAHQHGAPMVLGSATPAFETYFNALAGKYSLVELKERYNNVQLPQIVLADEKEAARKKEMISIFTPELHAAIDEALKNRKQVILFQNRRGYAPYIQCSQCAWIPKCKNCDVSLTYHKGLNYLNCHYCGMGMSYPQACPDCGNPDIGTRGLGTEKVVEEVEKLFPEARVSRMDFDTTRSKMAFQKIIGDFESHRIDILVGTQMISKGLDFSNLHVVGILSADQLINFPDYRAHERAYQVLTQVSGRAGRRSEQGLVIIQSRQIDHPVLQMVKQHHFTELFNQTLVERKLFRYPPYHRIIKIVLKHRIKERLTPAAKNLANRLRRYFGVNVLGPEYPLVARIQAQYQKEIWIKLPRNANLDEAKRIIKEEITFLKSEKNNSGHTIYIDVDPN
ncbi:MAG: primosomal protein N' [Mangrovibacterium sp.]